MRRRDFLRLGGAAPLWAAASRAATTPAAKQLRFVALGDHGTGREGQKQVAAQAAVWAYRNGLDFLLSLGDKDIYFACDTSLFSDMQLIGKSGVDLAVLPIGDLFTMGPEDGLRAVKLIQPVRVLPIHYDTFDVIQQDANIWKTRVEQETGAQVAVLQPGESLAL